MRVIQPARTGAVEKDIARRAVLTLGLGAFVVGTAELLVVGVLNLVAEDMGISVSSAGGLVTAYALGISLGGPLLTAATIRQGRRHVLLAALLTYVAGNLVAVATTNFDLLLVSRVVTGSVHGLFIGVAFVVAGALVAPDRQGRAISVVMGGITVSIVAGVPLGTAIGTAVGWRGAFVAVVVLGVLALAATMLLVPGVPARGAAGLPEQARAALAPRVLAMLLVGLFVMGGQFIAFTFLAPYLERVTGVSQGAIAVFLLVYGVAAAVGTFLGGRAADRDAALTLTVANALLVLALGLLYVLGSSAVAVALVIIGWGTVGLGLVPALQLRVITLAGEGGDMAAPLAASAANAGIAAGSLLGGAVIAGSGLDEVPLVALAVCAAALPATWASGRLRARGPAEVEGVLAEPAVAPETRVA